MLNYVPKFFTNNAIIFYILVLIVISFSFMGNILPLEFMTYGVIEVVGFFYFSNLLSRKWGKISEKQFIKNIFITAIIIRLIWIVFSYFMYINQTGIPFEWHTADSLAYHKVAIWFKELLIEGSTQQYFDHFKGNYSDLGYSTYLGMLYYLTNDSIIIARIIKAIIGSIMCVLVFRLAKRNFGDSTGRLAAIFCLLMPNLIYYTGLHLKETEMVFLTVWFIDQSDALLRNKKFSLTTLWLPVTLGVSLFFFRTVLGAAAFLSLFTAILFSTERVGKAAKRVVAGIWVSIAIFYFLGSQYSNEIETVWTSRSDNQSKSMEWRSIRSDGANKFAKYASTVVFAPLIFVIPFSTLVEIPIQETQMVMNGGNFVKSIMAFFVLLFFIQIIREKEWREHLLLITFVGSYLGVIAMSAFAQSERFHQPALPFILILAAAGLSITQNKHKLYFWLYLIFIFVALIAWNWFKLAGRGLV